MNQQRRLILKALTVTAVGAAAYGGHRWFNREQEQAGLPQWLSDIQSNEQLATLLSDIDQPYDQLLKHLGIDESASDEQLVSAVKKQVADDFNRSAIQVIDHWHLSQTEALVIASAIALFGVPQTEDIEKTFDNAPFQDFMTVEKWGPQETYKGVKFNEQPDGHCGFWVVSEDVPDSVQIYVAGKRRRVVISERGLTSGIYDDVEAFINQVGSSQIIAYDVINHRKQVIGTFEVLPPFPFYQYPDGSHSAVFSEIDRWGPQQALLGEAFNVQPNGYAAFWVKGTSRSNKVFFRFNGKEHKATVRKELMTTSFSPEDLPTEVGEYPVYLLHKEGKEELLLGQFTVVKSY